LRVIAIAFLTAIAGGILSVVVSLYLTELYHVSNFEGGRGMLIFFALAPLGFIVGFIIGLVSLCAVVVPDSAALPRQRGLHSESRSPRLFREVSISRLIIHPNLMANRSPSNSIESEGGASQFIKLKLRAKPRKEDEAWSDWITARERADLTPVPEPERIAVRYRVHPED
jgi:hypothetical protein